MHEANMSRLASILVVIAVLGLTPVHAAQTLTIAYIGHPGVPNPNALPLDEFASDEGLAGAELGIADDNGTGRFTQQEFVLEPLVTAPEEKLHDALANLPPSVHFVVANLPAVALVQAAHDFPQLTFLNAGTTDTGLRDKQCAANVLHTIPSRAMLADALAQYLTWKKWRRWFLVVGPAPADGLYADAIRRSAQKFGAQIVAEMPWTFQTANAHADTGHATLQTEIPAFTRVDDYDVLIVADEAGLFGAVLEGRTFLPRPVAGTQGLVATGWSPVNVEWGGLQLQNRFLKRFSRHMTAKDYAAWVAVRAIGEAAVRTRSTDSKTIVAFMRGPDFLVSGFKGQGQSFRPWNGQMRQPILIAGPRALVSASPQPGFLHRRSVLDTLGLDEGESRCKP
jgi:ABC transporter substrate binding protein (PQQ-dependent alcohol dehydrogenase system)